MNPDPPRILLCLLISFIIQKSRGENIDLTFPDDFSIGTASAAYQIEGAWNYSDKGVSLWDNFTHEYPSHVLDNSTGDITCDSYHKYKEDVKLLHELGMNHYRFSMSWSRLLPTGYPDKVSKSGVQYYHNLLDELEKYNITPILTLYHMNHPLSLEKAGGWLNESMAYAFADYARFVFQEFGHRIKHFATINEIFIFCTLGYRTGKFAPGVKKPGLSEYICAHNALKAHALAYHIYDKEFRKKQKGIIGLVETIFTIYNKDEKETDAKDIGVAFTSGWILHPVFSAKGNYPEIMIRRVAERSKLQGLPKSRLPVFSEEWIKYIRGSSDFLGVNFYTASLAEQLPLEDQLNWQNDSGIHFSYDPSWPPTEMEANKIVPKAIGDMLRKVKKDYNNPPVYILENGIAIPGGLNDTLREEYLYLYLKEMLIAMKRDNCNIKMYTVWSLFDSFEWAFGYSKHFGIIQVDHSSANRTRTFKNSASWIQSVIKTRKLQLPESLKNKNV